MDNATLIWINTVLLAMLGFCIVAMARWFFHKFDKMMQDIHVMATKADIARVEIELSKKIDEIHCVRSHAEVKRYLHTHGKSGEVGEAVFIP